MKKHLISFLIIFSSGLVPLSAQDEFETELLRNFHKITSEEMMSWVHKLCSPEFNGRLTGTPGFVASAEWVAGKFREWGLRPGEKDNSWFQWFDMPYTVLNNSGSLSLLLKQSDGSFIRKNYRYPDEYYPGMNSGSGEVTAEVVYVGFGITAPELNYDDYKGIDVRGKIVLMNRDVPYTNPLNPEYKKWVGYCYHQYKLENAVKHGAAGFLYIDGIGANPNITYDPSIIVCGIGPEALNDLFAGQKFSNGELTARMIKTLKPSSFNMGRVMTMTAGTTRHNDGKGCNVIGVLEGSDPVLKNEYIIIGGHLDAVGNAGQVVNGALDNASGVVDIMAAAKAMAESKNKIKRSVMFIAIGGEENGLLGSKLFVAQPTVPMEKTVVYINLDMVGNGTGLAVSGGKPYASLNSFFEQANTKYIHRPMRTAAPEPNAYYGRPRTDGVVFSMAGYRTMSVHTTDAVNKVFYHLPGDDPGALTPDIMEDVAKMLYVGLTNMADAEVLPPVQ